MFINCHIEQQMYFIYLPRWHPKIYNMAKMSQYLQTSWIPGLLAIIGFPGTLAQECCYFIADIILVLPECQHHLVWVYLRPYTFDGAMTDCHTISILMIVVMPGTVTAVIHSTLPSTYNTVNRACCTHTSSTGKMVLYWIRLYIKTSTIATNWIRTHIFLSYSGYTNLKDRRVSLTQDLLLDTVLNISRY